MSPTLLTPFEAGEILRCSAETVKRYVRSGELQAFRHRGRVLIPREAIERFVEERLTASAASVRSPSPRRGPRATNPAPVFDRTRRLVDFG